MITEGNLQRYRVTGTERETPQIRGIKRKSGPVPQFEPIRSKAKPAGPVIEYETEEVKYGVLHTGGPDPRDHPGHPEPDGGGGDRAGRRRRAIRERIWSPEELRERDVILEMAEAGSTYQEIAERLGVSKVTARKRVYKYGIQRLHKIKKETIPRGLAYTEADDMIIVREWHDGAAPAEIAELLGRSEASVKTRIRTLNRRRLTDHDKHIAGRQERQERGKA